MAEELFALLTEAKTVYLQEVKIHGKQYRRYVEDFVNSHRYIDCDNAVCRNCHEMNIHIVKGLLTDCPYLIQPLFSAPSLSFEECMELKRKYDTSELASSDCNPAKFSFLSFDCSLSRKQLAGIVSCANTYHLFCVSVRIEDMEALFACKKGFSIRVNNIRRVVILFDALLENSFIQSRWQNVLGKGAFLQSKDGTRSVSVSTLSSALSSIKNNMTSVAYSIRKVIDRLKE